MMPHDPRQGQGRRDVRLAWIIVGCSAGLTLMLLVAGLVALRAPLARWTQSLAAGNAGAPGSGREDEVGKARPDPDDAETELSGDNTSDLPAVTGEVRKRSADEQPREDADDGDEGSVRRGEGPRVRRDLPSPHSAGPIA